jgi:hypothetical protein
MGRHAQPDEPVPHHPVRSNRPAPRVEGQATGRNRAPAVPQRPARMDHTPPQAYDDQMTRQIPRVIDRSTGRPARADGPLTGRSPRVDQPRVDHQPPVRVPRADPPPAARAARLDAPPAAPTTGRTPRVDGPPTGRSARVDGPSTGRSPRADGGPSTGRSRRVDSGPSTGRSARVDSGPSTGRSARVDSGPSTGSSRRVETHTTTGSHRAIDVDASRAEAKVEATGSHRIIGATAPRRRIAKWPIACVVLVVLIVLGVVGWNYADGVLNSRAEAQAVGCSEGNATIKVLVAPAIEKPVTVAADKWNKAKTVVASHCIQVDVKAAKSDDVFKALSGQAPMDTIGGLPAAWIPESSYWTSQVQTSKPEMISSPAQSVAAAISADYPFLGLGGDDDTQKRAAQTFRQFLKDPAQQKDFTDAGIKAT